MPKLYIYGDSFSYGSETCEDEINLPYEYEHLYDKKELTPDEQQIWLKYLYAIPNYKAKCNSNSFGNLVATKLGLDAINRSVGGASTSFSCGHALSYDYNKNDIILLAPSFHGRFLKNLSDGTVKNDNVARCVRETGDLGYANLTYEKADIDCYEYTVMKLRQTNQVIAYDPCGVINYDTSLRNISNIHGLPLCKLGHPSKEAHHIASEIIHGLV